ncbi:serine/threonine-protein kinase [Pseudonocardia sp. TRM90224]|uniref:serine/threonine-protein kinase n=1 Tax=Pseudonocardia sp. TRM90224 TaxID=2812678 RepID=UPI001E42F7F3|nr:serine/threonine-protein kinase [Pseudonocardia sp. TRM90224]
MAEGEFGPYRLDRLLGRGGMGEVYRAYDTRKRDRVVALKLLPAHLSDDEAFRTRFRREAEIAALLHEPHVVPIHDYGEIDGRLFLDMRFVDGPDLGAVLAREGALAAPRAVAIVEQVAAALDAAHAQGLIHRDVKPSNILVVPGRPEFVYLVDFGIARAHTSNTNVTGSGETAGTVQYMAPERFLGGSVDHRVDTYALACVLFQLLANRPPFPGEAPTIIHGHLHKPAPSLAPHRADLGPGMDHVIARGMAKRPADRPPTAGALAEAARAALNPGPSRPVAPRPASGPASEPPVASADPGPAPRPPRRTGLLIAGLALAAIALGLVALLALPLIGGRTGPDLAGPTPGPAPPTNVQPDLAGTYVIEQGLNPDNAGAYQGVVTVAVTGEVNHLQWSFPTAPPQMGVGLVEGGTLAVGYAGDGAPHGVVVYRVAGGRLEGRWVDAEAGVTPGQETALGTPGLSGDYSVEGSNPDGSHYTGTLTISRSDSRYDVAWTVGSSQYSGVGLLVRDLLIIGYTRDGSPAGAVGYRIDGATLDGQWVSPAATTLGQELLRR